LGLRHQTTSSSRLRTGANGSGAFSFLSAQTGTYRFCVRSVRKTGYTYDPSQNVETCDTVVVE
jgi:hypothetical protein